MGMKTKTVATDVNDAADYIVDRLQSADTPISVLKLHKLLYYVQAWHLAFYKTPAFDSSFQAWVHGPVSRKVYDRFKDTKSMYSLVTLKDINDKDFDRRIPQSLRQHINVTLEAYGGYGDTQLEQLTHREEPWIEARRGCAPNERCETAIINTTMQRYYGARIPAALPDPHRHGAGGRYHARGRGEATAMTANNHPRRDRRPRYIVVRTQAAWIVANRWLPRDHTIGEPAIYIEIAMFSDAIFGENSHAVALARWRTLIQAAFHRAEAVDARG